MLLAQAHSFRINERGTVRKKENHSLATQIYLKLQNLNQICPLTFSLLASFLPLRLPPLLNLPHTEQLKCWSNSHTCHLAPPFQLPSVLLIAYQATSQPLCSAPTALQVQSPQHQAFHQPPTPTPSPQLPKTHDGEAAASVPTSLYLVPFLGTVCTSL